MQKIREKHNKDPIVSDLYSLDQLKISLDDLLVECVTKIGYKENFAAVDFFNLIGILSTILAGIVLYLSLNFKWGTIKAYIAYCVIVYFIINAVSTIITYFQGGKIKFDGLEIITRIDKTPVYVVLIYKKGKIVPIKYSKSVFDLFYEDGTLDHNLFIDNIESLFKEE